MVKITTANTFVKGRELIFYSEKLLKKRTYNQNKG